MSVFKESRQAIVTDKRETAPAAAAGAAMTGGKAAELKTCHPSVCVGESKPTSCVCPTPQKK